MSLIVTLPGYGADGPAQEIGYELQILVIEGVDAPLFHLLAEVLHDRIQYVSVGGDFPIQLHGTGSLNALGHDSIRLDLNAVIRAVVSNVFGLQASIGI